MTRSLLLVRMYTRTCFDQKENDALLAACLLSTLHILSPVCIIRRNIAYSLTTCKGLKSLVRRRNAVYFETVIKIEEEQF